MCKSAELLSSLTPRPVCEHFTIASCGPGTFSHVRDAEGRREVEG